MEVKTNKPKRALVTNLNNLEHGELVELIGSTPPYGVLARGTVEGSPWSTSGSGKPDMIALDRTLPSGRARLIEHSLENIKVYRVLN